MMSEYEKVCNILEEVFILVPEGIRRIAQEDPQRVRRGLVELVEKSSNLALSVVETMRIWNNILLDEEDLSSKAKSRDKSSTRFSESQRIFDEKKFESDSEDNQTTYPDFIKDTEKPLSLQQEAPKEEEIGQTYSETESDSGTDYERPPGKTEE